MVFSIVQEKSPSYLLNRYKLGRIQAGTLVLNEYECLYLFLKGRISAENPSLNHVDRLLDRLGMEGQTFDIFIVYNILKNRGFYVKMESGSLYYRKTPRNEYSGPVRVIRESETIEFREMISNGACIYAALDDDNDVTIFLSELWDEQGIHEIPATDSSDVTSLNSVYLVRASLVPEWYGTLFGDYKLLNRYEANYMLNTPVSQMEEKPIQTVYNDLISRKFIVKTGFKYGANFRVYSRSIEEHADFLVHMIESREQWYKISRAIRVAQGVRKEMVFAGILENTPNYVKLKRVKDPFSSED